MAALGGSIESVSLSGRNFPVAADAESQRKIGGFENEVEANGDGGARIIKTRVTWMADGLAVEIDDTRGDQEFIQDLANATDFFDVVITYASGESYDGRGMITGELQASSQNATMPITLTGAGTLRRQ